MAIYNSNIAAKAKSKLVRDGLADSSLVLGGALITVAEVEITSALATNDKLILTQDLQTGVTLVPQMCRVTHTGAASTTLTVAVGDEDDDDRYSAAVDCKAVGDVALTGGIASGSPVKAVSGKPIVATVKSAAGVGTGKLTFVLVFSHS